MLRASGMARATYYYHTHTKHDKYQDVKSVIYNIYTVHKGRYGHRRVLIELRNRGYCINHKTVSRLMQTMELYGKNKKRHYHSYQGTIGKIAPNVINRDFRVDAPIRKWTTDISQVVVNGVKCYISALIDMWNGEVIAHTVSNSPNLQLVQDMLHIAFRKGYDLNGLVLHSDQGWHYQHAWWQKTLLDHHIIQSMSRKGNCLDNAIMENFFALMKNEFYYVEQFENTEHFKYELHKYVHYYNYDRIKLRLGMSPVKYRKIMTKQISDKTISV